MMTYEEYKNKVYDIFVRDFLIGKTESEKKKYLADNEQFIKTSYEDDVYRFNKLGQNLVFTDSGISGSVCMNLDMLY